MSPICERLLLSVFILLAYSLQITPMLDQVSHAVVRFFTEQMPFLSPKQQCQSTEENDAVQRLSHNYYSTLLLMNLSDLWRSFWHFCILSLRFNGHFSRWTWVSQYQNVSILDFIGAKDDGGGLTFVRSVFEIVYCCFVRVLWWLISMLSTRQQSTADRCS